MSTIDVITVFDHRTEGYAKVLAGTGELLKSNKHAVNWLCVTLGKCKVPKIFNEVANVQYSASSGYKHAYCLEKGLEKATAPYVIISDVDNSLLLRNWDDLLFKKLSDKTPIVGFEWGKQYEKECYQNFPCVVFCLFNRKIFDSLNINLYQGTRRDPSVCTRILKNEKLANIFGHKKGDKFLLETAWRMPYAYLRHGYNGHALKKIVPFAKKQKRKSILLNLGSQKMQKWMAKKAKSGANVMHEFYLDDKLFASHLRRSRKYPSTSRMGQLWIQKIMQYMQIVNNTYFNPVSLK